jgi:hypothetical protein
MYKVNVDGVGGGEKAVLRNKMNEMLFCHSGRPTYVKLFIINFYMYNV